MYRFPVLLLMDLLSIIKKIKSRIVVIKLKQIHRQQEKPITAQAPENVPTRKISAKKKYFFTTISFLLLQKPFPVDLFYYDCRICLSIFSVQIFFIILRRKELH